MSKESKKSVFLEILDKKRVQTLFQPIISLSDGSVFGYEALSRGPVGTDFYSPENLIQMAAKHKKMWELEYLMRFTAIKSAEECGITSNLFLNVSPSIIHDKRFKEGVTKEFISQKSLETLQIVFEITERETSKDADDFVKVIEHYKQQNFKIAIDDAGAGYSGLNLISNVQPHFIKIDMHLVRNVQIKIHKQALISALHHFSMLTGTELIAEGIETEAELETLINLGIQYGQGYLIQKPCPNIGAPDKNLVKKILQLNKKKRGFGIFLFLLRCSMCKMSCFLCAICGKNRRRSGLPQTKCTAVKAKRVFR